MNINIRKIWMALFILYIPVLIFIIIFKGGLSIHTFGSMGIEQKLSNIQFIPFKTTFEYLFLEPNIHIALRNLLANTIAFLPLGFLLPLIHKKNVKLGYILGISFITSLSMELVQFIFCLGATDIDDLILNVLGSAIGFGIYKLIKKSNITKYYKI